LVFGKDHKQGIRLNGLDPEVVTVGENGVTEANLLHHDENKQEPYLAHMLSRLDYPDFPVPVGVLRAVQRPTYDGIVEEQQETALAQRGEGDLETLFNSGDTWEVV
jgi:2-oxoglutarate ferredoxin oxidoreductase subunit beta